jgi:peptidoglycan/LPS O-acetylase OafA/YrhL
VTDCRRLDSLTALRGIAASAVVLFHGALAFSPGGDLVQATRTFPVAVSFFFALSGFVLTWSWDDATSWIAFWRNRAARILPVYVLAWFLAVAALSWLRWTPTDAELLASLLLVQAWVPGDHFALAVNVPAWSLSCELAFYAALPFVAPRILRASESSLRRVGSATAAWVAAGCLIALTVPLEWFPGVRAPEFLAGVVLATWMRRGWRPGRNTKAVGVASVLLLVGATLSPWAIQQPVAILLAAPAILAVISLVAARDLAGAATVLRSTPLQWLGDWSYPLYLTHWIVVVLLSRFLVGAEWIPVAIVVTISVAAAVHVSLERPAQLRLRAPSSARRAMDVPTGPTIAAPGSVIP